jgi:hypothetical protein
MIEFYRWRTWALYFVLAFAPLLPAQAQTATSGWITTGAFRDFHVVIPDPPTPAQTHAGEVFQRYFKVVTNRDIGLSTQPEGLVNVWIGPAAVASGLLREWDLEVLGEEAFIIRTYEPHARHQEMGATKQLIIAGATDTGTLHGVYDFFRRFMDLRWLAPGVLKFIPPRFTFPAIDFSFQPPFPSRELALPGYGEAAADFREAHHLLGSFDAPHENTLRALVPPERYFADHPDFFGLKNGVRRADGVQPCLSNKGLSRAVWDALEELIASEEDSDLRRRVQWEAMPDTWTVSLNTDEPLCECGQCAAVIHKTGAASGLLVEFVNHIALLANTFPDRKIQIHTVAGGIMRRPPRNIDVAENVLIQVSSREADYSRPLEDRDSDINLALRRDLDGWSSLTRKLSIWDFAANGTTPLTAHPNLAHIQANLQFYDQFLVRGIYVDGWAGLPFSEMSALRSYLYGIHLWDPDYGIETARRDFFRDYYVQALAPIMAYVDRIARKVEDEGVYLSCDQEAYWFDYALVEEARGHFEEALAQRMTPEVKLRVQQAQLPVEWAAMVCPPRIIVEDKTLLFERPPCLSLPELEARMREAWPEVTAEQLELVLAPLRAALPDGVPAREERHPYSVLENDRFLLWIAPSLDGAIVRFQDKQSMNELLRGYQNYGAGAGVWNLDLATDETLDWTLAEATADAVTLATTSSSGIAITRSIRLDGAAVLESVTLRNTSAAEIACTLRTGPELFIQERRAAARIWTRPASEWQEIALPANDFGIARGQRALPPAAAHAVHLAAPDLTITAEVEGDPAPAHFTYDGEHQHQMAHIEMTAGELVLAPGESVTFALRYTVAPGAPEATGSGATDEAGER